MSLAYFDYQISSKHNFQHELKLIFVYFLVDFFFFLFYPGFLLTFLLQYAQLDCQMDGELPDV